MKGEGIGSECNFAKPANDDVDTCCKEHDMYCPHLNMGLLSDHPLRLLLSARNSALI
jgi:hypothetical protein